LDYTDNVSFGLVVLINKINIFPKSGVHQFPKDI